MKKIINLICSTILLIFISECVGYKPIYSSTNLQFKIGDYSIAGDKKLGNRIYSKLYNLSKSGKNNKNAKNIRLFINMSTDKTNTSKDSSGKILEHKITLNTEVKVTDFATDDKILSQTFISSLIYKVQDQYSDTIKLENKTLDNLIDKTYQELLTKLTQNIITK